MTETGGSLTVKLVMQVRGGQGDFNMCIFRGSNDEATGKHSILRDRGGRAAKPERVNSEATRNLVGS